VAAQYVYKVADWKTGVFLGELPLSGVTFTRMLQPLGVGTWQGTLPIADARVASLDPIFNTEPSAVELVIERNGIPSFAGPVLSRGYSSKTQSLVLGGREAWALHDRRLIEWDLTYAAIDQGLIVRDLLVRDAAKPDGDMRFDLPTAAAMTTGVVRTAGYLGSDCKPISGSIEELAAMQSGFEFYVEPYWATVAGVTALRHRFLFGYPRHGSAGGGFNWEVPGTTADYSWDENGAMLVNEVFGVADDGTGKVRVARSKLNPGRYPLLQAPLAQRAVTSLATATAAAAAEVARLYVSEAKALVAVVGDQPPELGRYRLGDTATFDFNDPRFLAAPAASFRLGGWTVVAPEGEKHEAVALILVGA
jgi:hypothetical protein